MPKFLGAPKCPFKLFDRFACSIGFALWGLVESLIC